MSGFFSSLGGGGGGGKDQVGDQQEGDTTGNNSSLFLFKNEEIYSKGFELWQQYYQLHQQRVVQQHHHPHPHQVPLDVDFSVGPSSSSRRISGSGDEPSLSYNNNNNNSNRSAGSSGGGFRVMRHGGSSTSSGSGSINCQDCGNQAKKDCAHLRCRTCCKSRGFHCDTHVKSTWVPAAKRRERQQQQQLVALQHQNQHQQLTLQRGGDHTIQPKRPRENPTAAGAGASSSSLACTRLNTTSSSGLEVGGHFPQEVNSEAVFRCVRVSAVDDAEEQYAYQTAVNIGGHVFRGILYDQGPDHHTRYSSPGGGGGGEGSSHHHHHHQQPLHLITAASATTAAATATANANQVAVGMLDPSVFPTPLNAFMAGTQFFPPPRP